MRHRQVVAVLALVGFLLSLYLTLYHYGLMGALACGGTNECEKVQASRYAELFGLPVALYGAVGYLAILVAAIAGLQDRWAADLGMTRWIAVLAGLGVAFTAYLTYLELFVIHAVCRWCVVSAALITLTFAVSLLSLRTRPSASPRP